MMRNTLCRKLLKETATIEVLDNSLPLVLAPARLARLARELGAASDCLPSMHLDLEHSLRNMGECSKHGRVSSYGRPVGGLEGQELWPLEWHSPSVAGGHVLPPDVGRQLVAVPCAVDLHPALQGGREEAGGELVRHRHAGGCIDDKHLEVSTAWCCTA